jgi:radical SAM protein with 4Fe4S-binding SPASM domain
MLRNLTNVLRRFRAHTPDSIVQLTEQPLPSVLESALAPEPATHDVPLPFATIVNGLIESHATARSGPVAYPPLGQQLDDTQVRAVAYGGALPSEPALRRIVEHAAAQGWALLPACAHYSEILAITGRVAAQLPADIQTWPAALLGPTPKAYLEAARANVVGLGEVLREQITANLRSRHGRPGNLVFELANVCNLACPMCPRIVRQVSDGLMSVEQATRLITELASTGETFTFYPHYLGETLIHPKFFEVIDHALQYPNININLVSNGLLLDRRRQEALLDRPLKNFHFSIHECDTSQWSGVDPRRAPSTRNILEFLQLAVNRNIRDRLTVGVSMVPDSLDDPAIEVFREFWQPVVDAVNIFPAVNMGRGHADPNFAGIAALYLPCTSPWEQPVIAHDGTVIPCCWDYDHTMAMGNVFESSFEDVWSGPAFQALRTAMLAGRLSDYPVCVDCEKWIDYLPSFRQVEMDGYRFSSTGTYSSFSTKRVDSDRLRSLVAQLTDDGGYSVPRHRTFRQQSSKKWIALQVK